MKHGSIRIMIVAAATAIGIAGSAIAQQMTPWRGGVDMWHPGWMQRDKWAPGHMGPGHRQRMQRHRTFMHDGVPADYQRARNPLPLSIAVLEAGGELYVEHCAGCHGATGLGDGDDGQGLSPSPALLAFMIQRPISVDEYMLWTISEGGRAFGTDMPAFKDTLSRDDVWKIVRYMRAGFPALDDMQ